MPKAFNVDVVSPESTVWSGEATFVVARTTEGEIGINNQVTLLTDRAELAEGDADDARKLAEGLRELEEGAE